MKLTFFQPGARGMAQVGAGPLRGAFLLLFLLVAWGAQAFPPAPHHQFYGLVRDEFGTPISDPAAEVLLVTASGVTFKTRVVPGLEPGVNYRLAVPMDAGIASDLYKPTALRPSVPFRVQVVIGGVTSLPIEMSGDMAQMGQPGKRTLLNLTLGEDLNGDGLPDAWQRRVNQDLAQVTPGGDADGDGMSNLSEYLAGTYAFDPKDGFSLVIKGMRDGRPVMRFTAIRGRTYTLVGSIDLNTWVPLGFRIPAEDGAGVSRAVYQAADSRTLEIEVGFDTDLPAMALFKLMVE